MFGFVPDMSDTRDAGVAAILDALVIETTPFSLCEFAPRGWLDMPRSPRASLHYVLAGRGTLEVAGMKRRPLEAGDLVLVPAGRRHALGAADGVFVMRADCRPAALGLEHVRHGGPEGGMAVLCADATIGLGGAGPVIDLLRDALVLRAADSPIARSALDHLVDELTAPRPGGRAMIRTLLLQCLIELLRRRLAAGDAALSWMLALSDRRLWPALAAILDRPGDPHTVDSLAETVGMSRSRFAEHFRNSLGAGPMEVVRSLRLQQAARLLAEGHDPIDRIARKTGYASRSHFTRQFEAHYGHPPGRWRRRTGNPA